MNINIVETSGVPIAEITGDGILINNLQDAVDLLGNCYYQGADKIIISEESLLPDFFDLKTGIAGDILQKFSNYNVQLAIVGDYSKFERKSLRDFIFESNKAGRINFVNSLEEARAKLAK